MATVTPTKAMTTRKGKMTASSSSLSDHSAEQALDDLRMQHSKLRAELDSERSNMKQLKHEKSHQAKVIRDEEQTRANIALKDVKMRIVTEKARDLDLLKDTLHHKYDADLHKVTKQKDAEIQKLRNDLKKCQNELSEVTKRGLSGAARGVFEAEREKMLSELQELRAVKRNLEESLQAMTDSDRQRAAEMKRIDDLRKTELARAKKDSDIEIRKLLDELRSKERSMSQLEREVGAQSIDSTRLRMEKESMQDILNFSWDSETWQDRGTPRRALSVSSVSTPDGDVTPDIVRIAPPKDDHGSLEKERRLQNKVSELNTRVRKLDDQCTALAHDKADLVKRIKELEKGRKPLQEKNRKFLEKNMSLTVVKRNLEEKLVKLGEETDKLKSQADHNKKENLKLNEQLSFEKLERSSFDDMVRHLDSLQREVSEHETTIEALKLSCTEKDRRIELIVQRKRTQRSNKAQQKVVRFLLPARPRPGVAGIKETYYGYDDDSRSIDSELSSSSRLSSSRQSLDATIDGDDGEDNVFEEFTREQYAQNYQRLAKENLELERSFALLQAQGANSHVDPQREAKLRSQLECDLLVAQSRIEDLDKLVQVKGQDTGWIREKEKLNKELRSLKEKSSEQNDAEDKLKLQLSEMEEENEVMEFRVLELEDANEKLTEESRHTVTFTLPPSVTDNGVLQMYAEEKGIMEIGMAALHEHLNELRTSQNVRLTTEDRITLVQASAMLDVSDKKLKELQNTLTALWQRIHILEEEKARLLSDATGVSAEIVLEYESVNNKLIAAQLQIAELRQDDKDYKKDKAVYEYTSAIYQETENRYKSDISSLQRQLSSSHEGRDYETEIISKRLDQLKELEQKICAVEASKAVLEELSKATERENSELSANNKDLLEQVDNLIAENAQLSARYTELLERVDNQVQSIASVADRDTVDSPTNTTECCEQDIGLSTELDVLAREIQVEEIQELCSKNCELQEQIEVLRRANSELCDNKTELLEQVNGLIRENSESVESVSKEDVNRENAELRLSYEELEHQSEEQRSRNEELLTREQRLNESNSELNGSNKELLEQVERLNEENAELVTTNHGLKLGHVTVQRGEKRRDEATTCLDSGTQFNGPEKVDISADKNDQSNALLKQKLVKYKAIKSDLTKTNRQLQDNLRELGNSCRCMAEDLFKARNENKALTGQLEQVPVVDEVKRNESSHTQTSLDTESVETQTLNANTESPGEDLIKARNENKALKSQLEQVTSPVRQEIKCKELSSRDTTSIETQTQNVSTESPRLSKSRHLLSSCEDYIESDFGSSTSECDLGNMPRNGDAECLKNNVVELVKQKEELETELWKLRAELDSRMEILQEFGAEKEQQEREHAEKVNGLTLELDALNQTTDGLREKLQHAETWRQKGELLGSDRNETGENESHVVMSHEGDSNHVDALQNQVANMEVNKRHLGETVAELRAIESELSEHIAVCAEESRAEADDERKIPHRMEQLETSEEQLRVKIDAVEAKLQQYQCSSEAQNDAKICEMRIVEIESQLRVEKDDGERLRLVVEERNERVRNLEATAQKLMSELTDAAELEKKLLVQMGLLQDAEEVLIEKVEVLEDNEVALKRELCILKHSSEDGERELQGRVKELRLAEEELQERIRQLEKRKSTLEERYEEEADKLHTKLDLLLDSEEKLLDRLQEQEHVEEEMRKEMKESARQLEQCKAQLEQQTCELDNAKKEIEAKQIELENYRHGMHGLSKEKTKLASALENVQTELASVTSETSHLVDKVKSLEAKMSSDIVTEDTWMEYSRQRIDELDGHNKELKDRVNELEKCKAVLEMQITALETTKTELGASEGRLREEVNENKMATMSLKNTIRDLEKSEASLKTQVTNVESQNKDLLMMVRSLQDKVAPSPYKLSSVDPVRARSPYSLDLVDDMTPEEMISRIHEMIRTERFHRAKITALSENLGSFREAVEVVTVTMDTDVTGLVTGVAPTTKDSEFERRVNEIVSTEIELKQKSLESEKKASSFKHQLGEAEAALIESEAEHRKEIEEMEGELDGLRKREARLKNQVQYGGDCSESATLAKIQHLEDLVFDLETSERKLKRHLQELEVNERKTSNELAEMQRSAAVVTSSQDRDELSNLLQQLRDAESSEYNMKEKMSREESGTIAALRHQVEQLEESRYREREDSAVVAALRHQVAQLEQSERGLRMKLRMLESSQEMTALERESMLIDSPEAVLKRRIRQLEGMERYMKQQLSELERDREELHEIGRRDKNTIHELNVQLRASQLSEKSLKDQLNRLEQQERHLVTDADTMTATVDELQEKLRSLQSSDRTLKVALQQREHDESELKFKLANAEEDRASCDQKLRKTIGELDNEKRERYDRCNELTDQIGDLEGIELNLKQKLRSLEGREGSYESRIIDLEQLESSAQLRIVELEGVNENLSVRLRSVDDGRSSLMYELSDLETSRDKQRGEIDDMQTTIGELKERLGDSEHQRRNIETRLDETSVVEERLTAELVELNEKHQVVSSNRSKEAEFLTNQLDFHRRTLQGVEDENMLLKDKLSLYECSFGGNQVATLPKSELSWLRSQERLLGETERKARSLEQSESYLKSAVAELRLGKDVCGHDLELERLKNQLDQFNSLTQAHKLLKENSLSLKQELRELQMKVESGVVSILRKNVSVNSKSVQVTLADTVTLKRLSANEIFYAMDNSNEFRSSLRILGAHHPSAYHDFIKLMQPTECNISHVRVTGDDRLPTATMNSSLHEQQRVPDTHGSRSDTDDIVMTMNFFDDTDEDKSDSSLKRGRPIVPPLPSAIPPLPSCLPPPASSLGEIPSSNSSYYLPSPRRNDDTASADEASEITDEDNACDIAVAKASSKPFSRAKSVDRDSDYSELAASQRRSNTKLSASLDSIPDSGLSTFNQETESRDVKAMIAGFERQIKAQDEELMSRETRHREQGAELISVKAKLEDGERRMTAKEREITNIRSDADTMRNVLLAHNIVLGQDGHYETMKDDKKGTKKQLKEKVKELMNKSVEVEKLSQELNQWQLDCWTAQDKATKAEQTLNVVQHELDTMRTLADDHANLKWQYDIVSNKHEADKDRLVQAVRETATLEKIVLKLRGQLKALERVDLERQQSATKVKTSEVEIAEKSKKERHIAEENAWSQHHIETLQAELTQLRHTVADQVTTESKDDRTESLREKSLMAIPPLRAKVIRLAGKCKAKDDLIGCLSRELRRSGGPCDLVAMADREQAESCSEDYNRPISPITTGAIESFERELSTKDEPQMAAASAPSDSPRSRLSERHRRQQSTSANILDAPSAEDDEIFALLSNDLDTVPTTPDKRSSGHRSKSTPNRDAEFYDLSPLTLPPVTNRTWDKTRGAKRLIQQQCGGAVSKRDLYQAVKDYNPVYFSCSGRPELDLPFSEGDILTVLGPPDETGYHEAELRGRVGLAPASYLLPLYPHAPSTTSPRRHHRRQTFHSSHADASPDQSPRDRRLLSSVTPTCDLKDFPTRSRNVTGAHPAFLAQSVLPAAVTPRSNRPGSHPAFLSQTSGATTLPRVRRRLPTSPAIQSPPPLDTCQAVPLASPIQDGQPDAPANFDIERIVGSHSVLLCWVAPALDEFGHNNGSRVEGYKICIDSRDKLTVSSAHLTKALVEELDLHRPHSFSIQTVADTGRMSSIVSVLFNDVTPQMMGRGVGGDDGASEHGSTPSASPRRHGDGRDTLRDRRVFMAVYDYTPGKLSTLTRPRQELSFRTGDIIITYGPPGADGFYYGKVHGKKGYIPASFIEEIALLKTKDRRSVSTNSLVSQHSVSSVTTTTKRSRPMNHGIATDV